MQFNKNDHYLVAVDIGTSFVKVVVANNIQNSDNKNLYIASVGKIESRGVRKGVVINIDSTQEAINKALLQAEELLGDRIETAYLAIGGDHLKGLNSSGVVKIKYNEVTEEDILNVVESARAIPLPEDREILHLVPQEYIVDGQRAFKKPLGIGGVRLEISVHIIAGISNTIQNFIKCLNRCNVNVKDIVVNSIASSFGVTTLEEREQGVCVIDIGAGTCDLNIFYGGALHHSYTLALGGSNITNDLASGLRTTILSAEKLKCQQGCATTKVLKSDSRIEIPQIGTNHSKIITLSEMTNIIEKRMTEIFSLLNNQVDTDLKTLLTGGVVLTGGGANLKGIETLAENVFSMPARKGVPNGVSGLSDFVTSPEFSTAVGMLKYLNSNADEAFYSNFNGQFYSGNFFNRGFVKVKNWISEHF